MIYEEVCQYDTLKTAYDAAVEYCDHCPDDEEAYIINLHNHLIWKSYTPNEDPTSDVVVLEAIDIALTKCGVKPQDADPETIWIINQLTQV